MAKQVDFYILNDQEEHAKFQLACRLAESLSKQKSSVLMVTESVDEAQLLDDMLWSFTPASFIAHQCIQSTAITTQDALAITTQELSTKLPKADQFDVLINLVTQSSDTLLISHHFDQITEIVSGDEPSKKYARLRYQQYQHESFFIKTHHVSAQTH